MACSGLKSYKWIYLKHIEKLVNRLIKDGRVCCPFASSLTECKSCLLHKTSLFGVVRISVFLQVFITVFAKRTKECENLLQTELGSANDRLQTEATINLYRSIIDEDGDEQYIKSLQTPI